MNEEKTLKGFFQQIGVGLENFEQFFSKPEQVQAAQAAFSNHTLNAEGLFKVVPANIVQMLLALRVPQSFEQLREHLPPEERPRLERLRDKALSALVGVEIHPAVMRRVMDATRRATPSHPEGNGGDINFNAINSITWVSLWAQADGGMSPMVRMAFMELPKGQLLDTTLNTDGLVYVVSTLTTILAEELERIGSSETKTMLPPGFVEDLDEERISKFHSSVARIERAWSDLKGQKGETH